MSNAITTGVRRLQTLGAWGLGFSEDILMGMANEGYDISVLNKLQTAHATDAQMQYLWDNFPAGSEEFAAAANQLSLQLTGLPGAAGGAGYPSTAVPTTVSTAFGTYDLAQQASWDAISTQLSSVRDQINDVARLAPKDPDVRQHVLDFNSRVGEFAGYYQQLFGSAPSSIPLASIPTLGIAPLIPVATIIAAVVTIAAIAYSYGQWAQTKRAQIAAQSQAAVISAIPAGATPAQVASILSPGTGPTNWSSWFQTNFGLILAALIGIAVVPPLLRRR
jgi:hypothetical protein